MKKIMKKSIVLTILLAPKGLWALPTQPTVVKLFTTIFFIIFANFTTYGCVGFAHSPEGAKSVVAQHFFSSSFSD